MNAYAGRSSVTNLLDEYNYSAIRLAFDGPVATVTLDRPNALNALSPPMVEELGSALGEVEKRDEVKALVIRGEGRAFCAGADLAYLGQAFDDVQLLTSFLKDVNAFFFRLEHLPLPVIALEHGYVLAGGLELMLACDIAAEDARIGDQHANYGLMPGGGSTQRLPRKIGPQRALNLLLTGRWLSGVEAQDWGLVLRAVPADKLDEEREALLSQLRDKSRAGLGWIKQAVLEGQNMALPDGVAMEIDYFGQYVTSSPHPREGIQAFKDRRQPKF